LGSGILSEPPSGEKMKFGTNSLSIMITSALLAFGAPVHAQSIQDSIVMQLQEQGYTDIVVNRTLLGRVRVVARNQTHERELVFNPTTGELLRDYWRAIGESKRSNMTIIPRIADLEEVESEDDRDRHGNDDDREDDEDEDSSDDDRDRDRGRNRGGDDNDSKDNEDSGDDKDDDD
jgi:hypothetical protein